MSPRTSFALGGLLAALAVVAGAFGAHALRGRLAPEALVLWETAARYLIYAAFGMMAAGAAAFTIPRPGFGLAAWLVMFGGVVFAGTLFALALGGPRWLGAVTPVGGGAMILGFVLLGWTAWRG